MPAPDFYNLIAAERGAPEGWRWFDLKAVGENREKGGALVKGAVCTAVYARGKLKGHTNWTKRDRSTERELFISFKEFDERIAQWERDTGKCATCDGSGQMVASVGVNGTTYRQCWKCKGAGKAAQ